ncbi:MAG: hypothetical protein ACRD29_16630 [Acidimicrobiales bacterium]
MSEHKSAIERALDAFFYAPIGLALNADDVIRQMAERGRQSVTAARFIGQMAVQQGRTEVDKALDRLQEQATTLVDQLSELTGTGAGTRPAPAEPAPAADDSAAPAERLEDRAVATVAAGGAPSANGGSPDGTSPAVATLAIPDYDSLAASQVLPRLAGLATDELESVRRYEASHRGRKTILNRVAQLQR